VRQHVAEQRIQHGIVNAGLENSFAKIVEHDRSRYAAQLAKGPFMEFGPRAGIRLKGEETHGLPAVTPRKYEQASSPVTAGDGIADHRAGAIVHLGFFS
jgi:hypothetical protein